ncbi:MAG: hypothetical protein UU54_C0002G0004 [Candidatus Yanofskybacteria bacterium GW2011_GWA2_41_22]|uniref:PEGA domain-containing protein n=5 Tax=Parcubacteria group TaxID=1794811 RepID=A0A1F8HXG2_9BACT|nr:MAG: hypothetical protein UU54_C0002G0004 [Candidatus Yanofskybacteria bacterium GW2011_GWA2_41_22]OGM99083.1 MAG: hypothetical protein A2736_02085 [Candidatus Yanofskybacteria bacterium RIFCSPHIGHO2_01_FULL_41_27]OGN09015.1 MAG: hypothetical protein A3C64_00260 [Candidatus Yanofskybacteria bacterium RIFCSPHIGHO2_02_FULL_41_12]OGN41720.1 MAG: hypothetical protein A2606_00360 [Candidatus Yanofskybacteria bacterium RIFOXYD1_FULL_42_10]
MTKTTKRITFYSAVTVFLALSYVISLYAQGYRYNFSERRFVRTGAIYLKVNTDADVFLNNKLIGRTTFLGNSYLINNLLPGLYDIRLSKNDFYQWQKKISVEEGLVNEFSRILLLSNNKENAELLKEEITKLLYPKIAVPKVTLLPTGTIKPSVSPEPVKIGRFFIKNKTLYKNLEPKAEKISDNVVGFSLSDDENKLIWWSANELWVLWLKDADYQPYKKENDRELITRFSAKIKTATWFRGGDHIVVDLGNAQERVYNIVEIDKKGGINIVEI